MTLIECLEKTADRIVAVLPRRKPADLQSGIERACLIAHRGAHNAEVTENTDAAFARALALGCWGIELDVHATLDQVLVVNHDPTLTRLWQKDLDIKALTFEQLRREEPSIPSLSEVVERYGHRLHLFIELKVRIESEAVLVSALQSLVPEKDYHLLSLDESIFNSLSRFPRSAMMLVAVHNNVAQFCKLSLQKGYGGLLAHYALLTKARKQRLLKSGQKAGIGFVNSKFSLYRELSRGHQWLFSDNVSEISACLKSLREEIGFNSRKNIES